MATSASPRSPRSPPKTRPSSITRGATARSASPRISSSVNPAAARRTSLKTAQANDAETERQEQLLVQLQNKEQTITELTTENDNLSSALNTAEARLNDLYAEQGRSELELAQRIDISEKLRDQVRELEKEKRDLQRRYNEQTTSFEAERQVFYHNEEHLKSRIQSLSQARKQPPPVPVQSSIEGDESETDTEEQPPPAVTPKQDLNDPETEPAEMTALKLELSTLATSYSSLQSTLVLLQSQLVDLKRVNRELQEENESYMILLREKTLSGQFNVMKQVGGTSDEDEDEVMDDDFAEAGSIRSTGRNTLDRVEEEEDSLDRELQRSLEPRDTDSNSSRSRQRRKRGASTSAAPRGESLADLPITGPGLDLAAELGRAENKDILAHSIDEQDSSVMNKAKRPRKDSHKKPDGGTESNTDLDALRSEVKALKDANKALSLYASKIIDRIIAQEGFEHVLAADYEKEPSTPSTVTATKPPAKARPQSAIVDRAPSNANGDTRTPLSATPKLSSTPNIKAQRRSLSFDWKNFSIFNTEKKPDPNLRPLTLRPGVSTLASARKLDNQEDEEDRRERERLNATMKLMGIQPTPPSPIIMQKSASSPGPTPSASSNRRFSFFGVKSSADNSETSSLSSVNSKGLGSLTQEALEHAEAENSLAALDAHERVLSAEISRGSASGFTEIASRAQGRRNRKSAGGSGSGSTVWSAGMSGNGEEED